MKTIADRTGWPALGLVSHFDGARRLPAEDSVVLSGADREGRSGGRIRIAVPLLPWISNFDDLDPLAAEPDVEFVRVPRGRPLPAPCDLVILPGSKATRADLDVLRAEGWDIDLAAHRRQGGHTLGLCGGYQMLGRAISDPLGMEGEPGTTPGLGLLDVETVLTGEKSLQLVKGATVPDGVPVRGYEMHVGRTDGPDRSRPLVRFPDGRTDGALSADGRVAGTYLHGFFVDDNQRAAWIRRLGGAPSGNSYTQDVEAILDALAAHLEAHIDVDRLLTLSR